MKIPNICKKKTSFDSINAGWYARNSTCVQDIVPEWTKPGGGVCSSELGDDVVECLRLSISYSKQRVLEAEAHIRKLEAALNEAIK